MPQYLNCKTSVYSGDFLLDPGITGKSRLSKLSHIIPFLFSNKNNIQNQEFTIKINEVNFLVVQNIEQTRNLIRSFDCLRSKIKNSYHFTIEPIEFFVLPNESVFKALTKQTMLSFGHIDKETICRIVEKSLLKYSINFDTRINRLDSDLYLRSMIFIAIELQPSILIINGVKSSMSNQELINITKNYEITLIIIRQDS